MSSEEQELQVNLQLYITKLKSIDKLKKQIEKLECDSENIYDKLWCWGVIIEKSNTCLPFMRRQDAEKYINDFKTIWNTRYPSMPAPRISIKKIESYELSDGYMEDIENVGIFKPYTTPNEEVSLYILHVIKSLY